VKNEEDVMNTTQYLFQSPYNSQVQFGRPDPATKQNEQTQDALNSLTQDTNAVAKQAQSFEQSQTKEVTPTVESPNQLDVYA
jgi:hypothetical protein